MAKMRAMKCSFKNKTRVKNICKKDGIDSKSCKKLKSRLRMGC